MKVSEIYRFQAQRLLTQAQAARDERAVAITANLLEALPCSESLVASYARQIADECKDQAVCALAEELAQATIPGDMRYRIEDLVMDARRIHHGSAA